MDLTVIIPAKDEEKYLKKCLNALRESTKNWTGKAEIILVDNGSKDSTVRIANQYECLTIRIFDGTIARLRNEGAKLAKGKILAFLDADCIVDPNWIVFCLQSLNNSEIAAVGTKAVPDKLNATWVEICWNKLGPSAERPNFVKWLGTSNLFVRKDLFFEVGGFNEKLRASEDADLCFKLRKKYKIKLEKRINTLHLRESKTLLELFCREYNRGKSNLKCFATNGYNLSDLPNVLLPLLNLISYILMATILVFRLESLLYPILANICLPLLFMLRKNYWPASLIELIQCYVVVYTYTFARTCSLINEIKHLLIIKKFSER